MLSQASPSAVVAASHEASAQGSSNHKAVLNHAKLPMHSPEPAPSQAEAPPWDTAPKEKYASPVTESSDTKRSKDLAATPSNNAVTSASITDLLFADFPEAINEASQDEKNDETAEPINHAGLRPAMSHTPSAEARPADDVISTKPALVVAKANENADQWYQTIEALNITGLAAELAKNCILDHEDAEKIELHLDTTSEMLMTDAAINEIEVALADHFGTQRKLVVAIRTLEAETPAQYNQRRIQEIQRNAEQYIEDDGFVRQLADRFAARVVPGSVKPKA